MDYKKIAEKLLVAFNESPYSYSELAKQTSIPKSALQRYITGDTEKIPVDRLRKICDKLGLDVAEVIGWTEDSRQNFNSHPNDAPVNNLAQHSDSSRKRRKIADLLAQLPDDKADLVIAILESILADAHR